MFALLGKTLMCAEVCLIVVFSMLWGASSPPCRLFWPYIIVLCNMVVHFTGAAVSAQTDNIAGVSGFQSLSQGVFSHFGILHLIINMKLFLFASFVLHKDEKLDGWKKRGWFWIIGLALVFQYIAIQLRPGNTKSLLGFDTIINWIFGDTKTETRGFSGCVCAFLSFALTNKLFNLITHRQLKIIIVEHILNNILTAIILCFVAVDVKEIWVGSEQKAASISLDLHLAGYIAGLVAFLISLLHEALTRNASTLVSVNSTSSGQSNISKTQEGPNDQPVRKNHNKFD